MRVAAIKSDFAALELAASRPTITFREEKGREARRYAGL